MIIWDFLSFKGKLWIKIFEFIFQEYIFKRFLDNYVLMLVKVIIDK